MPVFMIVYLFGNMKRLYIKSYWMRRKCILIVRKYLPAFDLFGVYARYKE